MTATFLLVRHAAHELLGKVLTGRMTGVALGPEGRRQADALAAALGGRGVTRIQSSPRERALETAAPIAAGLGLSCETAAALDEIDFGAWTGRRFDDLASDAQWTEWNLSRGSSRPPGGESMGEAQIRICTHMAALSHQGGVVVLVSHADMIKAAVLHVLGAPLDAIASLEVDPASVTTLVLGDWGGKVVSLNERIAA